MIILIIKGSIWQYKSVTRGDQTKNKQMKINNYGFFYLLFILHFNLNGQSSDYLQKAKSHIADQSEKWGLKSSDYENLIISSEAYSAKKGLTYMYLNQTVNGIPVRNAVATVLLNSSGDVVMANQTFISDAIQKVNASEIKILASEAIRAAAEQMGIAYRNEPLALGRSENGILTFSMPEFTNSDIPAELKYIPVGDKLVLVWNLILDMKDNADYWDYHVDAQTGSFVHKYNLTIYCTHHDQAFARHDNCNISTFRNIEENKQKLSDLTNNSTAARYRVFALPVESPIHGSRSIVFDDQYPDASPFGWHDTNGEPGPEFTITRGNNVYAYEDKDDDNVPDVPDTNGGMNLNFDFPLDMSIDPVDNSGAAVTNLFYMNNMLHDVTFLLGFTEDFGNFQQKNYTGAPGAGDAVHAQAFDGINAAEPKLNNANFSTPVDGVRGTMQMYLWTNSDAGGVVNIDSPANLEGYVKPVGLASFGKPIPTGNEAPISGQIIVAQDKSNPNTGLGCSDFLNASEMPGRVVLIDRGVCEFGLKALNAQRAGAIAVIICNVAGINGGNGQETISMGAGAVGNQVTIPLVSFRKSDCDRIRLTVNNDVPVTVTFYQTAREGSDYLDGSFDNGIIAHEYGHGISNRLTGGRTNSGCLNNDEQMGEGWSDFFGLVLTVKPEDRGENGRGIGTFAASQPVSGRGIRRFQYSTDMQINPQTFDDIKGTSGPHALGEIWTAVLWDMYWSFVNLYGYDPDWTNEESGNYKAVFLVMEGMKLQQCQPGFIEGRDAIFIADELYFEGKYNCLLWEVFARRGMGFYADGGITNERNDGTQDFEPRPTCIEALKITKKASSLVDPGADIEIELRTINHIPERQSKVVITDELQDGMSYVQGSANIEPQISGSMIIFDLGDLEYEDQMTITYKVKASNINKSLQLYYDNFEGNVEWDIITEAGEDTWLPNYETFRSPETSFGVTNLPIEMDASLISPTLMVTGTNPVLRFWHKFNTEAGYDGGFVQISVNNGFFITIPANKFIRNGYNGNIPYSTIAFPDLKGFLGNSGEGWIDSYIDLSDFIGQEVVFKFRFVSDSEEAATGDDVGWFIDDVEIMDLFKYSTKACIYANDDQSAQTCTNVIETIVNSTLTSKTKDINRSYFNVQILPNPASDYVTFHVSSPNRTTAQLSITSMDGKSVFESRLNVDSNVNPFTISTAGFLSGFYLVSIQSGNNYTIKKLVIR